MSSNKMIRYQLSRPISFIFLKHESGKIYNWIIPSLLAVLTLLVLVTFMNKEDVLGSNGLISELVDFLSGLPGFFIAALAAIATFNRPMIDKEMPNPPTIDIHVNGTHIKDHRLTRRDFLLRLFSFLTVETIFLIVFVKVGSKISVPQGLITDLHLVEWAYVSVFFLFFWQLITLLMFGLYYLSERLNLNE